METQPQAKASLLDASMAIQARLKAPSAPVSEVAMDLAADSGTDERTRSVWLWAVTCGYSVRRAQEAGPAQGTQLPGTDAKTSLSRLHGSGALDDDRFFSAFFEPGEAAWRSLVDGWIASLAAEDGEPPIEAGLAQTVEDGMRTGYLASVVDESYGLHPAWDSPGLTLPQAAFLRFLRGIRFWIAIVAFVATFARPSFIICVAAALNLSGEGLVWAFAVALATFNGILGVIKTLSGLRSTRRFFSTDLYGKVYYVTTMTGALGAVLLVYSFFT